MSGLGDATFIIDLDTSQLVQGSAKAKQIFQEMGQSGLQSMETVQNQSDNTSNSIVKMGNSIEKARGSITSLVGPITGLAASSASLYFSFDQLERSSIRVEQGHLRVEKAQQLVNKLQSEGKTNTDQYANAMQNLQIQQERYDVAQNMVNENMVFMGLNMVTLGTSTIPSVIKAVQALKVTQEGFAVVLEATMPWLLAITAAILAWEYAIAPLIKQHYNLDLGIQSNIEKLVSQHSQITQNIDSTNSMTDSIDSSVGAIYQQNQAFTTSNDALSSTGLQVDALSNKVKTLTDSYQKLSDVGNYSLKINGDKVGLSGDPFFSSMGAGNINSSFSTQDPFTMHTDAMKNISQYQAEINNYLLHGFSEQQAINEITSHYSDQITHNAKTHGTSLSVMADQLANMRTQVELAKQLVDLEKQRGNQMDANKKKASVITNAFGIPDNTFNQIASDLAKQLGLTQQQVAESFIHNVGAAYNPVLDRLYKSGLGDFGQRNFISSDLGQKVGMFGAKPFYNSVGNSISSVGGINIGGPVGGLHDENLKNARLDFALNAAVFGLPSNISANLPNWMRGREADNDLSGFSVGLQRDSEFTKFDTARREGLYTVDGSLDAHSTIRAGAAAYDALVGALRGDLVTKYGFRQQETVTSGDARRGVRTTVFDTFIIPNSLKNAVRHGGPANDPRSESIEYQGINQDALETLIAQNLFTSDSEFRKEKDRLTQNNITGQTLYDDIIEAALRSDKDKPALLKYIPDVLSRIKSIEEKFFEKQGLTQADFDGLIDTRDGFRDLNNMLLYKNKVKYEVQGVVQ